MAQKSGDHQLREVGSFIYHDLQGLEYIQTMAVWDFFHQPYHHPFIGSIYHLRIRYGHCFVLAYMCCLPPVGKFFELVLIMTYDLHHTYVPM